MGDVQHLFFQTCFFNICWDDFLYIPISFRSHTRVCSSVNISKNNSQTCVNITNCGLLLRLVCDSDFSEQFQIFTQLVQLIVIPFLYLAFLQFTTELVNPFGTDPHDFPRLGFLEGMRNDGKGFYQVAGKGTLQTSLDDNLHEQTSIPHTWLQNTWNESAAARSPPERLSLNSP